MENPKKEYNFFDEFNTYNRKKEKKVTYRYFPNRTTKQTKYITYGLCAFSGIFIYIIKKAYDRNIFYLDNEVYKKYNKHRDPTSAIEAQNMAFKELFIKAKRKDLNLNSKPLVSQVIRDEDENH